MLSKKGQMHQFMVPLVDKTDFASVESGITESDFNSAATVTYYGVDHDTSDIFTSGSVSKAGRLVRSGVFQITLKTGENNYDEMMVRITHPSAAEQIVCWANTTYNDSDVLSGINVVYGEALTGRSHASDAHSAAVVCRSLISDVQSYLVGLSAAVSDTYSAAVVTRSLVSDVQSALSNAHSDLRSQISGLEVSVDSSDIASVVQTVLASDLSDIHSAATAGASRALINQSRISDVQSFLSDFQSDLISHLDTTGVQLNASTMSDLRSAIADVSATVGASAISDIASRVEQVLASDLSDIHSAATAAASRALLNQSTVSDVYSLLSDLNSNLLSRIPKEPAARSQLSDLSSDLRSYLVGLSATVSDVHSAISDAHSDLASKIAAIEATVSASDISDIASAVEAILASDLSDIHSAATAGASRALINQSRISDAQSYLVAMSGTLSDVYSAVSDAHSDLKSAIGDVSVTLTASDISDIASAVVAAIPFGSQISDIYSLLSDVNSNLFSRIPKEPAARSQLSDLHSDLRSQVSGITAGVSASDISDIASAVEAILASDLSDIHSAATAGASRALLAQSLVSDTYSLVLFFRGEQLTANGTLQTNILDVDSQISDFRSHFDSRIPEEPAARSQLSDLASDLRSYAIENSGAISNVYSLLSDAWSNMSAAISDMASDVNGLTSTVSDIYSNLTAGVTIGASSLSDLRSAITAAEFDSSNISDIVSAMSARTLTEPASEPDFNSSFDEWMAYWAAISTNEIHQTSTVRRLRNVADDGNITSFAVADGGGSFVDGAAS